MPSTACVIANTAFPPKSNFKVEDIPDLNGRVAIVRGGNSGVGYETVKALLQHNAKVYMASRNCAKAEEAIQELKAATGREAIFLEINLDSIASVRKAAAEFLSKETELHILFNNGGVMWPAPEKVSSEGFDYQFATNAVGHFLLTELLIPALLAGIEASPDGHTRVITTSSSAAQFYTINWDTLKDGPQRRKMSINDLYSQSKFANVVVASEVARRYGERGIISISCDPGLLRTELQRDFNPVLRSVFNKVAKPASDGALTQLWAGTMQEPLEHNGAFLIPIARIGKIRKEANDRELGKRLWEYLVEATEL